MKKILETKRLILRELNPQDTDNLLEILSDSETMKYYPRPYKREEVENWIKRSMKSYEEYGYGLWAVIYKENEQFIGQCGISNQNINGKIVPEIGYHINKNYWNRGLATEAAKACMEYGFDELKMNEIYIHTYVKNIPSMRIAEKLGMKKINEYDKEIKMTDGVMRHCVYRCQKSDFR